MKRIYKEIVELEILDDLIEWDNKLLIGVLLSFIDELNRQTDLLVDYRFEVIAYGFQGYYPVIAVEHLSNDLNNIENQLVNQFRQYIKSKSLEQFITFVNFNRDYITKIVSDIDISNKK